MTDVKTALSIKNFELNENQDYD